MSGRCAVVLVALPDGLGPVLRRRLQARTFGPRPDGQRPETLAGRVLARRLVAARDPGAAAGLRLLESGKPVAGDDPDGPAVSISHTAGIVAVAVAARGPLGVDVERVGRYRERVARRVFAGADADALAALPAAEQAVAFTRLWTAAEACSKLSGEGLARLFGGLGPLGLEQAGAWSGYAWSSRLAAPGLALAVAGPEPLAPALGWLPFAALVA